MTVCAKEIVDRTVGFVGCIPKNVFKDSMERSERRAVPGLLDRGALADKNDQVSLSCFADDFSGNAALPGTSFAPENREGPATIVGAGDGLVKCLKGVLLSDKRRRVEIGLRQWRGSVIVGVPLEDAAYANGVTMTLGRILSKEHRNELCKV